MTSRPPSRERLNAALRTTADERGIDVQRLRRHLVFQRMLVRLGPSEQWVLKGGFALEARLAARARATRDLDLALLTPTVEDIRELLLDELAEGEDGFVFEVGPARPMRAADLGNTGWRLTIRCTCDGAEVSTFRLDVVTRGAELDGAVSLLRLPPPVLTPIFDDAVIPAVEVAQHAAEKVHAMARDYPGGRPSSRVKDLLDLVLMVEAGLLPDEGWGRRLQIVFAARDAIAPPPVLPEPPEAWRSDYPALARETGATAVDLDAAVALVSPLYAAAVLPYSTEKSTEEAT